MEPSFVVLLSFVCPRIIANCGGGSGTGGGRVTGGGGGSGGRVIGGGGGGGGGGGVIRGIGEVRGGICRGWDSRGKSVEFGGNSEDEKRVVVVTFLE